MLQKWQKLLKHLCKFIILERIRLILIYSFLLLVSFLSFGQKNDYHIINLLPIEDDTITSINFYVSIIIDNRTYKDNLGIAQKGMFNKKVLSTFNKPFEEELIEYFNVIFPPDLTKQALVVRVNQLLISENTGAFKETGKATVNLDVLSFNQNKYMLLGSFSAYAEKNSMDVTGKHDDRIREILKSCIIQFSEIDYKNVEQRLISVDTQFIAPAILNEPLKKGFYTSFSELYTNMPFQDSLITFKESNTNSDKLFLDSKEHKRALYYAFSNGESIFINAANYSGDKHFVKTEKIENYLLFNDTFINQDKATGMSMAFGVLGLLASNEQTNVLLNLNTGQYHNIDNRIISLLLKEDFPELFRQVKKKPNNKKLISSILKQLLEGNDKEKVKQILEGF